MRKSFQLNLGLICGIEKRKSFMYLNALPNHFIYGEMSVMTREPVRTKYYVIFLEITPKFYQKIFPIKVPTALVVELGLLTSENK